MCLFDYESRIYTCKGVVNADGTKTWHETNCLDEWRKTTVDSRGREIAYEDSDGNWRKITYNNTANMMETLTSNKQCMTWTFDSEGKLLSALDTTNKPI